MSASSQPKQCVATKIKPVGDRILVEPLEEKEQIRGGIVIPDSAKERPQEARIVALGSGKRDKYGKVSPFEVSVGDRVLVSKYGGSEVRVGAKKDNIVREDDILGVLS